MSGQLSGPVERREATRAAALLLALGLVLSQWSYLEALRWALRLLPLVAVVLVLFLPADRRNSLRVSLPLLAFAGWCVLSALWTADPSNTFRRCVDLLTLVAVGWLAGQVLGPTGARRAIARVVRAVLVACVVTLVLFPDWSTAPGADGAPGWHALFPHKNGFGFFCAVAFVTLAAELPSGWRRRLWLSLCVALVVGSQSASALAATAAAACLIGWHVLRSERPVSGRRLITDTVAAAALAVALVVVMLRPATVIELLGRDSSLTGRREIWTAVLRQIEERPWQGYGFGGVWDRASPVTLDIWREARFEAFYAHSGYLDLPLQVGLIGSAIFLVLVGSLLVRALTVRPYAAAVWPLGLLAVLLVTAFTESSPFTGDGLLLISLLAGALLPSASAAARPPVTADTGMADAGEGARQSVQTIGVGVGWRG